MKVGRKLSMEPENNIPEAIDEQTVDETNPTKKHELILSTDDMARSKIAKSRVKSEKAQKVIFVPAAQSNDSSVRKMVSIYAPQSFRRADSWRSPIPVLSKSPDPKKAKATPSVGDSPSKPQIPPTPHIEPEKHHHVAETTENQTRQQDQTDVTYRGEQDHELAFPDARGKVATEVNTSFCERFSNWEFFSKCNTILGIKFERIKSTSSIEFQDLSDSKKVGLAENIIMQVLLKTSPNGASAPNLKHPPKNAVVKTASNILNAKSGQLKADAARSPVPAKSGMKAGIQPEARSPVAGRAGGMKVGFKVPPDSSEPAHCLDFPTFVACIRRIAERLGQAELAALLKGPAPAPTPAARWASLPSVVSWNLPTIGAGPARRRPDPQPAEAPTTPWTLSHRKAVLRPRTSVRRLLALQDKMRREHTQRVIERSAKAEAEAQQRRRLLAAQKEKELFEAQRSEIKLLLLQKAEHGMAERRRQHAAEEQRGRLDEVRRALPAEQQRDGASPTARAQKPGPPPLYALLRRKEESRSLGGRLGFDCRLL